MAPQFIPPEELPHTEAASQLRQIDTALVALLVLMPNFILALAVTGRPHREDQQNWWQGFVHACSNMSSAQVATWVLTNIVMFGALTMVRRHVLQPIGHITHRMHQLHTTYLEEAAPPASRGVVSLLQMARDINRFAGFALEYYRKNQELSQELEQSRQIINQFASQQQMILSSANREIGDQYRAVLAYANYLDIHIAQNKLDPSFRYDFDDVSESSFNLKLIAGALSMLTHPQPLVISTVPLATLLQQTMLALAPTLDRRCMKLTTAEVDLSIAAQGDPSTLANVLWMMLLGMIRYAAQESTLRIRCMHSRDGTQALMSIVVSELSPGQLSEDERQHYLARQLEHLTPHMFAETIRIHGNVQLAEMLISRLKGSITVLPLTVSACEICMALPSAVIENNCM